MTPASAAAAAAAAVLALFPIAAHAEERDTVMTLSAGLSMIGPLDASGDGIAGPEMTGLQLRGVMSFEPPPLDFPAPRKARARAALIPELLVGTIRTGGHSTEMFGAGARLEVAYALGHPPGFRPRWRGAFYLLAHGGVFSDAQRTRFVEAGLGEYINVGASTRIGIELDITSIRTSDADDAPAVGGAVFGPPFDQGRGSHLAVNAAFYVGVTL